MRAALRAIVVSSLASSLGLAVLGSAADAPARVVLLGPSETDPTVVRLRRELKILGIDAELVLASGEGRRDLGEIAREHHAPAVVALDPSPPRIVLWFDPSKAPAGAAGPEVRIDEDDQRVLVLRAVEILRERLLSAPVSPVPAPTALVPTAVPPPETPEPPALPVSHRGPSVFAGPAVLASPGGVGATPHVWLGARWAPKRRVDLELAAFLPTTAATLSALEGSMTLRTGGLVAGVGVKLTEPAASFFVTAGAGLGAMLAGFEGQASPPWQSAGGLRASLLPYVHAAAGYWFLPRVALRADVMAGFALPEPVLLIAGQRVATFGEPATLFAAGIEVRP